MISTVRPLEVQGHRGARGLRPENTLASFEYALDTGVHSLETDVHLSADDVPVLFHDAHLGERLCRLARSGAPHPRDKPAVRSLTLDELRCYFVDINPDPVRFPDQQPIAGRASLLFCQGRDVDPLGLPTLADLLAFVRAYTNDLGVQVGKTEQQRAAAARVIFDVELKREPFSPENIGDDFDGKAPGLLEKNVVEVLHRAGLASNCRVRSFDHRSVAAVKMLDSNLATAVLVADTALLHPGAVARQAGADFYCPDYRFLDADLVRRAHEEGVRVLPWTVNEPAHWEKLLVWAVDGITTDYPDRLVKLVRPW